jgi:hypothetical protein
VPAVAGIDGLEKREKINPKRPGGAAFHQGICVGARFGPLSFSFFVLFLSFSFSLSVSFPFSFFFPLYLSSFSSGRCRCVCGGVCEGCSVWGAACVGRRMCGGLRVGGWEERRGIERKIKIKRKEERERERDR